MPNNEYLNSGLLSKSQPASVVILLRLNGALTRLADSG